MTTKSRDWHNVPPAPWDLREAWPDSPSILSTYLRNAFAEAFGIRPTEVTYATFPDVTFADVVIDGEFEDKHNVWGVIMGSRLRSVGVDISVVVRAASEFEQVSANHKRNASEVRKKIRNRRSMA